MRSDLTHDTRHGLSLTELAMAMILIGVVAGGIVVGRDMLRASSLRDTLGQIEQFNAAAAAFKDKYKDLPGDLPDPGTHGLAAAHATGTAGRADGNGLIESSAAPMGAAGETLLFWTHLAQAQLLAAAPASHQDYDCAPLAAAGGGDFPPAKLGGGIFFHVAAAGEANYIGLGSVAGISAPDCKILPGKQDALTIAEAFVIDTKTDDGDAAGGKIISIRSLAAMDKPGGGSPMPNMAGSGDCYSTANGAYANTNAQLAGKMDCELRFKAGF